MYRRILLPLDGSPLAEQALPHSAVLAERFQAELILLKVHFPSQLSMMLVLFIKHLYQHPHNS